MARGTVLLFMAWMSYEKERILWKQKSHACFLMAHPVVQILTIFKAGFLLPIERKRTPNSLYTINNTPRCDY